MKSAQLLFIFCLLAHVAMAQNYYVAAIKGQVYYNNKLLAKRDKVKPDGEIRFKNANSYVKLSGPGGLYTLWASHGKASGNEFLLTLSNELFPPVRMIATLAQGFSSSDRWGGYWYFRGWAPIFLDQTMLPIKSAMTNQGQIIVFVHETDQGLAYRKADIQHDSVLVIHAADFDLSATNLPQAKIKTSAILQIEDPAMLDTLLANHKTIADLKGFLPTYGRMPDIPELQVAADWLSVKTNQILDILVATKVIDRQSFIADLRDNIERCKPKFQAEFLYAYRFANYIESTYGSVYGLTEILRNEFGLNDNTVLDYNMGYWGFSENSYSILDKTALPISPDMTAEGQRILLLHETDQGLVYREADIRKGSTLLIHAADFELGTRNSPSPKINKTAIVQIGDPAILAPLLANNKTIDDVRRFLCACHGITYDTPPKNQILDQLGACRVLDRKDFIKDLGFFIKKSKPETQGEFLRAFLYEDYIDETYGKVYQLEQVLEEELGLFKGE